MRALQWVDALLDGAELLTSIGFGLILVGELVNLVLRYIFASGIPEISELGGVAVVVVGFLGMARGFLSGDHVNFGAVLNELTRVAGKRVILVPYLLAGLTLAIVAYVGFAATAQFAGLYLTAVSMPWLPFWVPMATIPIGSLLGILGLLRLLGKELT